MAFTVEDPATEIVPQFTNAVSISTVRGGPSDGELTIDFKLVYQKSIDQVSEQGITPSNERETRTKNVASLIMTKAMAEILRDLIIQSTSDN